MENIEYWSPEIDGSHETDDNLDINFHYQCNVTQKSIFGYSQKSEMHPQTQTRDSVLLRSSSFSRVNGAALSANFTLVNTNICNGLYGEEILPDLDSPNSFKKLESPSFSRLNSAASLSPSLSADPSTASISDTDAVGHHIQMSAPAALETSSFFNATDVQVAGGAAGEDRVQAVCSEENGWLFCGVYDGFNGRDAADYLASTLYEKVVVYRYYLESVMKQTDDSVNGLPSKYVLNGDTPFESYDDGILKCLSHALAEVESDFMMRVEEEMCQRPDLVSVGSSVLAMLLNGNGLYVINLGDSRAVLATYDPQKDSLRAEQLTKIHSVDNELERRKVLSDHPDDPKAIINGYVKGTLKLSRALGVGYLKKSKLNNALPPFLRIEELCSPPYIYTDPFTKSHKVSDNDLFVVLGSDGLFDLFSNDDVVKIIYQFIQENPAGDPAKYLIEELILKAAERAGFSAGELMGIPAGVRRRYHDDVSVVVIILGNNQRMSKASTSI